MELLGNGVNNPGQSWSTCLKVGLSEGPPAAGRIRIRPPHSFLPLSSNVSCHDRTFSFLSLIPIAYYPGVSTALEVLS